jgi:D-alanyl-D-alanine carboxypeptidase/D-alanyl-D-alanine-endopeptidase (penicillin-binding protein 4)
MLRLITELKNDIEKQGKTIEDVIAVPGSDGGTFRNRVFPADFKNSFVAKTGTLMHTSTLAGAMNTQDGFSFFGIFNQSRDITGSKIVQNSMVQSIIAEMGGPKSFDYTVERFHTYNNETLKNAEEVSDFSSVSENLY